MSQVSIVNERICSFYYSLDFTRHGLIIVTTRQRFFDIPDNFLGSKLLPFQKEVMNALFDQAIPRNQLKDAIIGSTRKWISTKHFDFYRQFLRLRVLFVNLEKTAGKYEILKLTNVYTFLSNAVQLNKDQQITFFVIFSKKISS